MKLVLLGAPGSGKGTLASQLQKHLRIPHVSTGDMLRAETQSGSDLGKEISAIIDKGHLVPDYMSIQMVQTRLKKPDCKSGFILDGFPRTMQQAIAIPPILYQLGEARLDAALYLKVPDEIITERVVHRLTCPKDGSTYHTKSKPPLNAPYCDVCGSLLVHREDDKADVIKTRLERYYKNTSFLIAFYKGAGLLKELDGTANFQEVFNETIKTLGLDKPTTLYRPIGPKELDLIKQSDWSVFPPRLEEQPFFYPVLNEAYADEIASKWNVREHGAGHVVKFQVDTVYLKRYDLQTVGSRVHVEYWVPAEDLAEFNQHIIGKIELIKTFNREYKP